MQFHIGPHVYTVAVTRNRIFDGLGDELDGLAVESARLILISGFVEKDRREEVLHHELRHAWGFHVPPPHNDEQACQLHAMIAQATRKDLDKQGGIGTLLAIQPREVKLDEKQYLPGSISNSMGASDRRTCSGCGTETMCGSIKHDPPECVAGKWQMLRWLECDCGAVQVWHEFCDEAGRITGEYVPVPEPRLLRGSDAAKWRREHSTEGELTLVAIL